MDTCICSRPTSICPYIRNCSSINDPYVGSYWNTFPTRTYCSIRDGTSTNLIVTLLQRNPGLTSIRLNCTFNQLPTLTTTTAISTTPIQYAFGYCNGTQLPVGGCNNGQVYMRFEYNDFNSADLTSGNLNVIGATQLDSCECLYNYYWNITNRLIGCTKCSQTCDSITEYCDNTNTCICRTGYIRDLIYNNTCQPQCQSSSWSYNIPYCDNYGCPYWSYYSSKVQCDGIMGMCVCNNIQSDGLCPITFTSGTHVICKQPMYPNWGMNACECVLDESGQCIIRGQICWSMYGNEYLLTHNQTEICYINSSYSIYNIQIQIGYPDSYANMDNILKCQSRFWIKYNMWHSSYICSGHGQRFVNSITAYYINSSYIISKLAALSDTCQCDIGYSGNNCNQLFSGPPNYCDNNTTYCTRNGTCLCKEGLIPQNGYYPTSICDCPNSLNQYGTACTDCPQCTMYM